MTAAVIEMLADSRDPGTADALPKDSERMSRYTRVVFRLLGADFSRE